MVDHTKQPTLENQLVHLDVRWKVLKAPTKLCLQILPLGSRPSAAPH